MKKQYKNFPFAIPQEKKEINITPENKEGSFHHRPTLITVLCGYFFVSEILSIVSYIYSMINTKHVYFLFGNGWSMLISLLFIVSVLGYWFMRKWGVYLYTFSFALSIIYVLIRTKTIFIFPSSFILYLAFIISGFYYLKYMK